MATIREALLSVEGEDATSIQPIVTTLSELGFNEDAKAGGAFRLLDAHTVAGLNVRQQLALKAAIQGAPAGLGVTSTAAAGAAAGLGVGSAAGAGAAAAGLGTWSAAGAGDATWLDTTEMFERVSRLIYKGKTIGTAVRLAVTNNYEGNIIVVPRHAVEEQGACLLELWAFGSELEYVAARADLDAALFKGPWGSGFLLEDAPLRLGMPLGMLSFPEAVDKELAADAGPPGGAAGSAAPPDKTPVMDTGIVSKVSATGKTAIASMNTGMPNRSGGAVATTHNTLAGIYLGIVYHLQKLADTSGSPSSSSPSSSPSSPSNTPASNIELDSKKMWAADDAAEDEAVAAAAGDPEKAAELSVINIQHKTSCSIFVTASALRQLLEEAKVFANNWVDTAANKTASRAKRGRSSEH